MQNHSPSYAELPIESNMNEPLKRVLDVGNCGVDHAAIRHLVEERFPAEVIQFHTSAEALAALRRERFDLVLVNRKFDRDYDDGIALIRAIKADPQLAETPVMLITNYEEYQQTAIAAGAARGFGKSQLADPATVQRLAEILE